MKSLFRILTMSVVITLTSWITPQQTKAQEVTVGFQAFYDDLSPYGTWVNNPEYGYVWLPGVEAGFTPYGTNGYWANTDAGWTWVSNYPWGWAPFHYGRWYMDPMYGNMWVPGNEWGPGWVTWRQSEGYYGWAPIGPGISLEIAYSSGYSVSNDQWRFVRDRDFGRQNINNYYVDRSTNVTIIQNSTVINNTYVDGKRGGSFNTGPHREDVEKRAGKTFAPMTIKENSKHSESVGKGELQIYRPNVQKSNSTAKKEAPAKVTERKDLKEQKANNEKAPAKVNGANKVEQKSQPAKQEKNQPQQKSQPANKEHNQPLQKNKDVEQKTPVQRSKQEPTQPQQKNQQPAQQKAPVQPSKQEPTHPQQKNQPQQQPSQKTTPPNNQQQRNENKPNREQPHQQPQQPQQQPRPQQQPPQQNKETPRQQQPKPNNEPRQEQPRQQPQPKPNNQPHQEQPRPQQQPNPNNQPRQEQPNPQQQPGNPPPKTDGDGKHQPH